MKKFYFTRLFLLVGLFGFGQSTEVGVTEGQLSVSLSGGANYTIPIAVPPGINGVVPQISLTYNSQGGNGIAGYGWNISGVSTISRIPATKFHDNVIDAVDFNALDRFALDSQRLIIKNGTNGIYGANGTVYETESFSNIKITSFGVHPNGTNYGPAYFLVEYPDGSKAYYGNSADSRSVTDWAITYWENPQGVRISYSYLVASNVLNISSIKYGVLSSGTPLNEIQFKYNDRQRAEQGYIGGVSLLRNTILKEIKVLGNNIGFRNYVLGYDKTSLGYDKLINVTEKNGDNSKSYNPTVFTYELSENTELFKIQPSAIVDLKDVNNQNAATISGDFDGDGKTDFIVYPLTGTDAKKKFWLYTNIIGGSTNRSYELPVDAFDEIFTSSLLNGNETLGYKFMPMEGFTIIKNNGNTTTFGNYSYGTVSPIYLQYEKQYDFPKLSYYSEHTLACLSTAYKPVLNVIDIPKRYLNGDFNGDGLTDVVAIETNLEYYYLGPCDKKNNRTTPLKNTYIGSAYFINLDKRQVSNFVNVAGKLNISTTSKTIVADFNGDGKSDLIVFDTNKMSVYSLNNNNQFELLTTLSDLGIVLDKPILMGDYNGDGKIDFVIPQADNVDSWNFYFSTGINFKKLNTAIGLEYYTSKFGYYGVIGWPSNTYSLNEGTFIANDFNGDGKTDILYQQNLTVDYIMATSGNIYARRGEAQVTKLVLLENKSCTGSAVSFNLVNKSSQFASVKRYPIPIFTNHNRINQNLEYSLLSDNAIRSFNSSVDNRKEVLLKKVTTGNGVIESISYQPLKNNSREGYNSIYIYNGSTENYPKTDILLAQGLQVVTKLEKQSENVYKKQLFAYYGAVSHFEGLGFLGFRAVSKTNWHQNDSQMISSIVRNDINLRGANIENYSILGYASPNLVPTAFITKSLTTYNTASDALQNNKVFKLKALTSKQFNGLEGTSTETLTDYDGYNNPVKATTVIKEGAATVQTTISTLTYNSPTISPYVVGRPASKNQSVTIAGDVMTTEELYTYNNNLLAQIKKKGTNTDYIIEDNVYDSFGNITKKTISATGITSRITSYGYDTSGRFLIKSTDIEGLSTSYVYNSSNGLLTSETNPFGLITSYLYDSWFKKTKTTDYLGKNKNYSYTRNAEKAIIISNADDGSATEETFDDLGRKIKSGIKSINGSFSYVDYLYDIYDRNYKVSEPYFGSSPTQWNETLYDNYGRVKQQNNFTGKITTISYAGLSTTINDGTKSKTSVNNAIGNTMRMTDSPGGTINYTYFANGSLKESEYNGNKTTIAQDGWGRKTKLTDGSAGIYTYEYNILGETTKETTPNGTTVYTLNPVGKLTQKTISGTNTNSKTTYTYDPSSKLLLNSKFEDFTNGTNTIINDYTYDSYKRIVKTVETTPYASFTKAVSYDAFGRIELETSAAVAGGKSSAKTIKNVYKNGSHWQILDNATSSILWQVNSVNARGQLLTAENGPISITKTYDTYGLASQYKYDKTAGSINILTLNTVFDPKQGNLISRTNSLFGRNESFKYDAQDRLTEFTNVQGVQEKQFYDDQGRITQNNLGTYSYNITGKPYQNSSVTVTPEALTYYTAKPAQIITYNTFKSPVQIEETGIDKISFNYNGENSRTAMFYGGLQNEKLQRPLRKYYSADGTMEIKHNIVTGALDFVTYIGGDGYSAPIVVKSNGAAQNYLCLQRDYQGSILAVTDANGTVLEKRLFDAWGAIVSVKDGGGNILTALTILDRGYTGHEHLQSVGLINMNGRIYDPKLHRFLQPDNFVQDATNTQSFNRYAYCWNNPLKYADYNGEWFGLDDLVVAATSFVIGYVSSSIATGNWGWNSVKSGLISAAMGWIGYNTLGASSFTDSCVSGNTGMWNFIASSAVSAGVSYFIPPMGIQVNSHWGFSISPSIAFGNTMGVGANFSVTYNNGDFSFSAGVGIMSNSNYNGFGKNGLEIRKSILAAYDDGKTGVSLGTNFWSGKGDMGEFKQQTGSLGLHSGDFRAMYENDGSPFQKEKFFGGIYGDGMDRFRTAALSLSVGKFSGGFNLFTGSRTDYSGDTAEMAKGTQFGTYGERMPGGFVKETGNPYRLGAAYTGYGNYRVGINSDRYVRHPIQDIGAHWYMAPQPGFYSYSNSITPYVQYRTTNSFTTW